MVNDDMNKIKLIDLKPRWVGYGGEGITRYGKPVPERFGVGISFRCPCGECKRRLMVYFENPLDGKGLIDGYGTHNTWRRTGKAFEDISLTPSILRKDGCRWHGFLTDGILRSC